MLRYISLVHGPVNSQNARARSKMIEFTTIWRDLKEAFNPNSLFWANSWHFLGTNYWIRTLNQRGIFDSVLFWLRSCAMAKWAVISLVDDLFASHVIFPPQQKFWAKNDCLRAWEGKWASALMAPWKVLSFTLLHLSFWKNCAYVYKSPGCTFVF